MPTNPPAIELSALDGTTGFQINGEAASDVSGCSVAGAGDVNGDGFADLIIGARLADPNGGGSGASYVVFGKASGFASSLELSALDGSDGFQISGEAADDRSGRSVAGAGDVNGDGFADLIVGAHYADPNGSSSGASYVVFGKASGFASNLELSALDGTDGFQINGEAVDDRSGWSAAGAGDVNGDGFADLIVGARLADPNGSFSGASYVVFGKASGFASNLELSALDGSNGFRINGEVADDQSGYSVAGAGDVNGDGFADLIVGADGADPNGGLSGASYVVFGKASGFASSLELSTLDGANGFQISGEAVNDFIGYSVAGAGDVNGDGFADLIVGAFGADPNGFNSGASYVVFGKASGFASGLELSALDGSNGFQINGEAANEQSGLSVAGAGDVNGDGFADLIIGARLAEPNGSFSGTSYVVFGKASSFASNLELSALDGSNGFRINGEAANDYSGGSVAGAGDVNGDGFADLVIGADGADPNGSYSGASYVIYGSRPLIDVLRAGTEINNRINGGFGDDALLGYSGSDTLIGWEGDDMQTGGSGADLLDGGTGNDTLNGGSGNDTLSGGVGDDSLNGGSGNDIASYAGSGAGVTVNLGTGATSGGHAAGDSLASIENLIGSGYNDRLTGNSAANRLTGGNGNDTLNGGAGNDTLFGGNGNDRLVGANGNDTLIGGTGGDRLNGDSGNDAASYAGSGAGVTVNLGTGVAFGGHATDDSLTSIESLIGSGHNDRLTGNSAANRLTGGNGNDTLIAGNGNDSLEGGGGLDSLNGGAGNDTLDGGDGNDTLFGGGGNDTLNGGNGNDVLDGGSENDQLRGGNGGDTLDGGIGRDTLTGGNGRDVMTGGGWADRFDFNAIGETQVGAALRDRITDFAQGADVIDLAGIDAIAGAGNDAFTFIGSARFSATAGELRQFATGGGNTVVTGDVDGNGTGDFQIALTGAYVLTDGDFVL